VEEVRPKEAIATEEQEGAAQVLLEQIIIPLIVSLEEVEAVKQQAAQDMVQSMTATQALLEHSE